VAGVVNELTDFDGLRAMTGDAVGPSRVCQVLSVDCVCVVCV